MLPWKHLGLFQDGIKSICALGEKERGITRAGLQRDGTGNKDFEGLSFTGAFFAVFMVTSLIQCYKNIFIYVYIHTYIGLCLENRN